MTAPNQSRPDGAYQLGTVANAQGITEATLKATLNGAPIDSFTRAQNVHGNEVRNPLAANSTRINGASTALANHENRIVKLEDGSTISTFYTNDTWHKPAGYNWHTVHTIGGGPGGQCGEWGGSARGGQGGGRGGWDIETYADADLTGTGYAVTVGTGGLGGYAYYFDDFNRSNSLSLGTNWRTDSANAPQILSNGVECCPQVSGWGENGSWASYNSPMLCDNVFIVAETKTASIGQENLFTGIYIAGPDTFSAASKLVMFVVSTKGGCGLISQVNAPAAAGIANGVQTGQAVLASTTTNYTPGQRISLRRMGNVFTAYLDNTQLLTWTDTSNTVPTGVGNRRFGVIVEGAWASGEKHSAAIDTIYAYHLDALAGTDTTFSGSGITTQGTGSGGHPGATYGTGSPASMGSGNQSTPVAAGGMGGASDLTGATAGGDGTGSTGGAAGSADGQGGRDGGNLPTGQYGPGSAGGGGQGSASSNGGQGGNGGFPGGPGGGGGGVPTNLQPGGGGNGSPGLCVVISSVSAP
ncbi:hypothetical protein [Nocardia nova]|uniref:hypothetical protein n=1 Tax=Nocardia nova TaxID=37330 RepID=UPI0027385E40|nr:hypothetical protein [Nocardia nova]